MTVCEMCGRSGPLVTAIIEGTQLSVCKSCARMGKIVQRPVQKHKPVKEDRRETIEMLVNDYSERIRKAREQSGLTQKEFANKLNEKESIIQKIESGTFRPTIEKARRFEKALKIKLVEKTEDTPIEVNKKSTGALTIGDIIKVR